MNNNNRLTNILFQRYKREQEEFSNLNSQISEALTLFTSSLESTSDTNISKSKSKSKKKKKQKSKSIASNPILEQDPEFKRAKDSPALMRLLAPVEEKSYQRSGSVMVKKTPKVTEIDPLKNVRRSISEKQMHSWELPGSNPDLIRQDTTSSPKTE